MFQYIDFLGTRVDSYSFFMLVSFVVLLIAAPAMRPKELKLGHTIIVTFVIILFSFIGAALFNILINAPANRGRIMEYILNSTGAAYLGAPILGLLALWIFCRIVRISFLTYADYAAPFFMLDRFIGRTGCLGWGCCYGKPSDLPWAYPFHAWPLSASSTVARHPTQAYAMIAALAIFISARYLYKKAKDIPGVFALQYKDAPASGLTLYFVIICYSFLRFFNEFLRAEGPFLYGQIKQSHIVLLIFMGIGSVGFYLIFRRTDSRADILKVLKAASARLMVWLIAGSLVILSVLSIKS